MKTGPSVIRLRVSPTSSTCPEHLWTASLKIRTNYRTSLQILCACFPHLATQYARCPRENQDAESSVFCHSLTRASMSNLGYGLVAVTDGLVAVSIRVYTSTRIPVSLESRSSSPGAAATIYCSILSWHMYLHFLIRSGPQFGETRTND